MGKTNKTQADYARTYRLKDAAEKRKKDADRKRKSRALAKLLMSSSSNSSMHDGSEASSVCSEQSFDSYRRGGNDSYSYSSLLNESVEIYEVPEHEVPENEVAEQVIGLAQIENCDPEHMDEVLRSFMGCIKNSNCELLSRNFKGIMNTLLKPVVLQALSKIIVNSPSDAVERNKPCDKGEWRNALMNHHASLKLQKR